MDELSESPTPEALACPRCGGRFEVAAKVYFDLTAAERLTDGVLAVAPRLPAPNSAGPGDGR